MTDEENRWSAFTDDELAGLWDAVLAWAREGVPSDHPLGREIQVELERREGLAGGDTT